MPILLDGVRSDGLLTATCEAAATTAVPSFAWDMVLPMGASTICAAAAFVTKELILLLSLLLVVVLLLQRERIHSAAAAAADTISASSSRAEACDQCDEGDEQCGDNKGRTVDRDIVELLLLLLQ